jgi:transposase
MVNSRDLIDDARCYQTGREMRGPDRIIGPHCSSESVFGEVLIRMLENVKQVTIGPLIQETIDEGSVVCTDEYDIYARLPEWSYDHRTICHAKREYARDDDGDGFCETHVNTLEEFWSLRRSWLRPHRGISQEKLPLYLAFFEFIHNVRARGKSVLGSLIGFLIAPSCNPS